ncbi:MAG: TonB-dependent receptor [Gammaproteobacteria bacterium]|nr:TonB-dependent receptor [Gammaproteobacteria bacterium]
MPDVAGAQDAEENQEFEEIVVVADGSQVSLPDAYAGGQVARGGRVGIFGNLDMMDTPFAGTSYTADFILDQQARGVADVLLNDPVVRAARGFGNFQEVFIIRGFPAFSDDMTYNGIYGILPRQYVATEFLERVELFRGASAFLNGAAPGGSSLGGIVNLVPKRAPDEALTRFTVGFENDGHGYGALDIGRRFGPESRTGVRVNLASRNGETSVASQDRDLTAFSVGLDYEGERLRLAADIGFQDHVIDAPRPSVTPFGGIPEPPDAKENFAQPWTYTDERQLFGVVRGEYDLTDNTAVWLAVGGRNGEEANVLSNPNATADGNTSAYRFDNAREDDILSAEIGFRADFTTGEVGHRLTVSASNFSIESKNAYGFSNFFAGFASNLYRPTDVMPPAADWFVGGVLTAPHKTFETNTDSIAIADMLSLMDDTVLVTVGARHQNIENLSFDFNSGAELSSYDEGRLTPMAGIVVKRGETISIYANYIEGLVPGEVAPASSGGSPVVNAGEVFEPYQLEQLEAGVKYDGGDFGGTASVFTLSRPSAFVENNVFSVVGEQRNRGVEISVFGQPLESVRLLGGLTFLGAELVRNANASLDGNDAVGTPELQVNLNLEWDVPTIANLVVDARAIHTDSQWADAGNTITVPSWTRFDIGARYTFDAGGRSVTLRARLDNVTDQDEWVSVGGYPGSNYLVLGIPRTLSITASVDF